VYSTGTKSVRLDEHVYELVESHKRDDETFSEAVERLIGEAVVTGNPRDFEPMPDVAVRTYR